MRPANFVAMMTPPALATQSATGVPAGFLIALAAVKSNWFDSKVAREACNLFGQRADSSWHGETFAIPLESVVNGRHTTIDTAFCKYPDVSRSVEEYAASLVQDPRCAPVLAHRHDSRAFARAVGETFHATDLHYAQTIIGLVDTFKLAKFDLTLEQTNASQPTSVLASETEQSAAQGPGGFYGQLKAAFRPLQNAGSRIRRWFRKAPDVGPAPGSDILRNAPIYVPGSHPTLAQVAGDVALVLAEKAAAHTFQGAQAKLRHEIANNSARLNYVRKFAGTDEELQNAIKSRDAEVALWRERLAKVPKVNASPILDHLDALLKESNRTSRYIKDALTSLKEVTQDATVHAEDGVPMIRPDFLDGLRENTIFYFDRPAGAEADVDRAVKMIARIEAKLVGMIDDVVPGYAEHFDQFVKHNVLINEMQLFRSLGAHYDIPALNAALEPTIPLDKVRAALKKADDPYASITPEGKDVIKKLTQDLLRETISKSAD